jgi:hypothetical protein
VTTTRTKATFIVVPKRVSSIKGAAQPFKIVYLVMLHNNVALLVNTKTGSARAAAACTLPLG